MGFFGQAVTDLNQLSGWVALITTGGFGLLAWYLIARVIPKLQDDYRSDVKGINAENSQTIRQINSECAAERRELVTRFEASIDKITRAKP